MTAYISIQILSVLQKKRKTEVPSHLTEPDLKHQCVPNAESALVFQGKVLVLYSIL